MIKLAIGVAVVAGLVCLASIPVMVGQHFQRRMAEPPWDVANGTVVAVDADGAGYLAIVEFRPGSGATVRARVHVDAVGSGPRRRPMRDVGSRVIVEFDPANPVSACLGGIELL